MSLLLTPLKIRDIELKNRLVMSPMCQYSSVDGFANDWHLVHLGSRAVGGVGLVFTEATAVSRQGRISDADLGIWSDDHIAALQRITRFILDQNSIPGIQLAHAGRKAGFQAPWKSNAYLPDNMGGWGPVAPSAIPFSTQSKTPFELTENEIDVIISDFGLAADRAFRAGFKVLEIHAAHGYLIHEFLSPMSNHRTDKYGGNFENRIRFLLEIITDTQRNWPKNLPFFVRLSTTEWDQEGWQIEDTIKLVKILKNQGVDLIDCSSGGNIATAAIPVMPGYQVPFSEVIKKEVNIKTGAVGLITSVEQAEEILLFERADLIFMGRELLRNPYLLLNASKLLAHNVSWPEQYQRAK